MQLQLVNSHLDRQSLSDDTMEVCDILTDIMKGIRDMTFELSSPVLDEFGLEAAIANYLSTEVKGRHGLDTRFTDDGTCKPLAYDSLITLYRSIKELLVNAVKYSEAEIVRVDIKGEKGQICISVQDDGVGFEPDSLALPRQEGGFGLFSIRERLGSLGGSLEIQSRPAHGCQCVIRAPLEESSGGEASEYREADDSPGLEN